MANLLAQSNPAASTLTNLVTLSGGDTVGQVLICNQDTVTVLARLAVSPGGAAIAVSHYFLYDVQIGPGRTLKYEFPGGGLRVANGTIIRGRADSASVSFQVLGA